MADLCGGEAGLYAHVAALCSGEAVYMLMWLICVVVRLVYMLIYMLICV